MLLFILFAEIAAWIVFTLGFCLSGTQLDIAKRLKKQLWNGRIDKLGKPPFSVFLQVYEKKSYVKSFLMVLVCNAPGHIAMFFLGFIKIGVVMLIIQPFMQGAVVGIGDDKTRLWGVITAAFEVTGFVVSNCLGFWGAFNLWWIPAVFLVLNALIEAGGTLAGIEGVPGAQAVKNKEYIE